MPITPKFEKVFDGVATRRQMHDLLQRVPAAPPEQLASGAAYAGRWFEIEESDYERMFELLPPLFIRDNMFAFSERKAGPVGSVFFRIAPGGRARWFHGYCDLADPGSPDAMRTAIVAHEKAIVRAMTREQKLDRIWDDKPRDYRGVAGEANPDAWPAKDHGKRSILIYDRTHGTVLTLLQNLSDEEIADQLRHYLT